MALAEVRRGAVRSAAASAQEIAAQAPGFCILPSERMARSISRSACVRPPRSAHGVGAHQQCRGAIGDGFEAWSMMALHAGISSAGAALLPITQSTPAEAGRRGQRLIAALSSRVRSGY